MSSLCVLGFLSVIPAFAAAPPEQRNLAAEVKAVFQAKCAECHGPQVRKPKGKFGYVLDLKKLAADPDKVVPGKPEDSQLWQLVQDEEMPPEEAKAGPLAKEQKQIIHDWIAAGAPSTSSEPPAAPTPTTPSTESVPTPSAEKRLLRWLGKFHVIVVHFPIALLLAKVELVDGSAYVEPERRLLARLDEQGQEWYSYDDKRRWPKLVIEKAT